MGNNYNPAPNPRIEGYKRGTNLKITHHYFKVRNCKRVKLWHYKKSPKLVIVQYPPFAVNVLHIRILRIPWKYIKNVQKKKKIKDDVRNKPHEDTSISSSLTNDSRSWARRYGAMRRHCDENGVSGLSGFLFHLGRRCGRGIILPSSPNTCTIHGSTSGERAEN